MSDEDAIAVAVRLAEAGTFRDLYEKWNACAVEDESFWVSVIRLTAFEKLGRAIPVVEQERQFWNDAPAPWSRNGWQRIPGEVLRAIYDDWNRDREP